MIKFFRKIRQKMLTENKFSKYLLYAIGEIILVVIGILIALGINNWKNNSENRKIENNYYCQLLSDLKKDKQQLQFLIEENQKSIETGKELIKNLHTFKYNRDEIIEKYIVAIRSTSFISTNVSYTDLTTSGNLDLLKNESLKELLIQYQNDLEAINGKLEPNRAYKLERFMTWENVLEFGWQSPGISAGLNLDEELLKLLPDNKWYLDKNSVIFQKCQDIVFYCMTVSNREIELYKRIQHLTQPLNQQLDVACQKYK
jgi:hypothetical protein